MIQRPAAAAGIVAEELDAEVCLYRPDNDEVLILNETAGDIWRLSDGELTVNDLIDRLASSYQVERASIEPDVISVITDLADRGYLQDAASSS